MKLILTSLSGADHTIQSANQAKSPFRHLSDSHAVSAIGVMLTLCFVAGALLSATAAVAQDTGGFSVQNNVVLRDGQPWLSGDQVALLAAQTDSGVDWGRQVSAVSVSPDRRVVAITLVGANHGWEGLLDASSKSLVDNVLIFGRGIRRVVWSDESKYLALETSDATGSSGVVVWSREGWTARVVNVIPLASSATSIEHPEWSSKDSLSVVVDGTARVAVAVEQLRAAARVKSPSSATIFVPRMDAFGITTIQPLSCSGTCNVITINEVASAASGSGFIRGSLVSAIITAWGESSFAVNALANESNGTVSRGLWQINSIHSNYDSTLLLTSATYNAGAAHDIFASAEAINNHFCQWGGYNLTAYNDKAVSARQAAQQVDSTVIRAINDAVSANQSLNVRATAGGTSLRFVAAGTTGTVLEGPVFASSGICSGTASKAQYYVWWKTHWNDGGQDGWSAEDYMSRSSGNSLPDLVITALSAPSTGTPGGQITVSATVANQGAASAGAYRLGFYLSTDATITSSDTLATTCNMPALSAGNSQACSGPLTIPSSLPPGTYYLGAFADDLGAVTESSDGNNTAATQIALGGSQYTISVSAFPSAGGTVSGGGTFASGSSRTVTASANSGYSFSNWTESGGVVSSSTSYTFTLTANRTFVANFTVNPVNYTISVSASPSAGGTVGGGGTFAAGSSRTVTAAANSGYSFVNWTEGGGQVSSSSSYTFTLTANRSLVALFSGGPNPAPSISLVSPSSVTAGDPGFALTVDGSGFIPASVVNWNGGQRQTTYVSSTELTALINAGDIASQGSATVTVVNPAPGGGTSGGATVSIQPGGGHCTPISVASCPFTTSRSLTTVSCTTGKRGTNYYTDVFSFAGTQGANVVIDLTSSSLDTYLFLVAPDGTVFTFNDDSNGTTNSQILATLSVSGTWTVEATSFSSLATGSYTLSLTGCGGGSLATPSGLVVTYNHTFAGVNLVWNGVANAVDYEGEINGSQILDLQTSGTTQGVLGLGEPACYFIRVRAVDASGQRSGWSNRDIATSVIFSDDPLTSSGTPIKAAHFNELRAAVATVRAAAGLSGFSYSYAIGPGTPVRAIDTIELRNALNGALSTLGLPSVVFADPVARVSIIQASDLQRLRNAMK